MEIERKRISFGGRTMQKRGGLESNTERYGLFQTRTGPELEGVELPSIQTRVPEGPFSSCIMQATSLSH